MSKEEGKRSEIWVEMVCGLDVLVVPTGMLVRLSAPRHECMDYIPGNVPELVQWIEKSKDHHLLWEMLEEETFAMVLPSGVLIKSESLHSESMKFIPMGGESAKAWLSGIISDKEK